MSLEGLQVVSLRQQSKVSFNHCETMLLDLKLTAGNCDMQYAPKL